MNKIKNIHKILIGFLIITIYLTSCKKDVEIIEYNPAKKGKLTIEYDNIVGSSDLQINTGSYKNSSNEEYKITTLKYFVSNFKFTNVNGFEYVVPQDSSYFLIDESNTNKHAVQINVPEGEYSSIQFVLGVDSLRNTLDISKRQGDIDVTNIASDMYWGWNSGYIFFKLEGTSSVIKDTISKDFQYHIGGFGGYSSVTPKNYKSIQINLTNRGNLKVKESNFKNPNVHLLVDINKVFSYSNTISFTSTRYVHSISGGVSIANNLLGLFTHDHTEN